MAAVANLVHETSTTTGTGDLTLVNVNGKQSFNDAFGTGGTDVFEYFVSNQSAAEWERGTGHLSDATTLVRDTVIESTNSDAAVNFSAGTKDVTNDVPAASQITTESTATEADPGILDKATDAEIRAATSGAHAICAEDLSSASALVTLTDAATVAVDWTSGINFTLTITANRVLGNPTNEIPGTFRTIYVVSDGGPDTLTFGSEYGGTPPTLDDITTTKAYLVTIYCRAVGQFLVTAVDGSPA